MPNSLMAAPAQYSGWTTDDGNHSAPSRLLFMETVKKSMQAGMLQSMYTRVSLMIPSDSSGNCI